jgi:hypothetical protein
MLPRPLAARPRTRTSDDGRARPPRLPTLLLASAVACVGWAMTACATAVAAAGLIIIPHSLAQPGSSYFELQARPGASVRAGTIELRNTTAAAQRVALAPVDGTTLDTLGSTYRPYGSYAHGSTRWLLLERRTVTIPPGAAVAVPVAVRVPRQANAGDYLSGVSIETLDQRAPVAARGGVSIASVIRYAIGVELLLPGPRRPKIRFTGAGLQRRPAGLTFLLDAANPGNVILQGVHGHVLITRAGHTVLSRTITPGTFVAHTAIVYPVPAFNQTPAQGTRYAITAWLRYRGGIAWLRTTVPFGRAAAALQRRYGTSPPVHGGTPWWQLALLIAALLYGLFTTILLLARRRSRERDRERDPHGATPGMADPGAVGPA